MGTLFPRAAENWPWPAFRYHLLFGARPRVDPTPLPRGSTIKRTYQPKKRYRKRVHGFLRRMSSPAGARVVQNRRRKGRHKLTPG